MKNTEQTLLIPPDAAQIKQAPVMAINPSGEKIEIAEIVASQAVIPQEAPSRFPRPDAPCRYWHHWVAGMGEPPAFEWLREG